MSDMHDPFTERIIGCAIEVHRRTGAGMLESVYDVCLALELEEAGFTFRVLVELKSVEALLPVHKAQVLTYLKLTGLTIGLLVNFNVPVLRDGIRRIVWTPPLPQIAAGP